jgi:amino acid transporter/nucleotide-binding universal stress UspA family protein
MEAVVEGFTARPRELRWYHAAGFLFGDWGTSRLYVLGLAFVLSGYSSFWYVLAMCVLVTLVGVSYTVICRHFPDGGGVYSSAKERSRNLAVVGALLLFADYIITAGLSAYVGFRYILPAGVDSHWALYAAVASILAIGAMNSFGLRRPGVTAFLIGLGAAGMYLILAGFCVRGFGHADIQAPHGTAGHIWGNFANVILALSGVEAIANMTGVMAEPVARNSRWAILTVMVEVVALNLVMAYGMSALPQLANYSLEDRQDFMLKILATEYVHPWFATVSSIFFGVLLLSAANTAMTDMVSIQYLMSRDRELPTAFTRLNRFGMPWVSLLVATVVTASVLLIAGNHTELLASLYAIGVVGAIAINLLSCGSNWGLELRKWERAMLLGVGLLMAGIELTVAYDKPKALLFAGLVLGGGLAVRGAFKARARLRAARPAPAPAEAPVPGFARIPFPAEAPRLLVSTRGNPALARFATGYAKDKKAVLFVLFVREVALGFRERVRDLATESMNLRTDRAAQELFADAKRECDQAGVTMVPLYAVYDSPAELIIDNAATLGVEVLIMGASRRGALSKALRGDVLQEVVEHLPAKIPLLVYA